MSWRTALRSRLPAWLLRVPLSLSVRVALTVLGGFVMVFVVLAAVISHNTLGRETGELDRAFMVSAKSMLKIIEAENSDESARIFVRFMDHGVAGDNQDLPLRVVVLKRSNQQLFAPPSLAWVNTGGLPDGIHVLRRGATEWRLFTASGPAWQVSAVDDDTARRASVLRDLGSDLAFYLLLAVPCVLVPVWLAVRAGLAPLLRLSETVAARSPQDMSALPATQSYRELLPLEAALNAQFAKTAQSLALERAFVHDAAHELRTPLAVIATQAHVLATSEGPDRLVASQRLQAAVTRASHLTAQLLRLAQADAAARVPPEALDLMDLVRTAMANMAERARAQGTELELSGPDRLPWRGHGTALRSVVDNLLDNALRYGGAQGAVQVSVTVNTPTAPSASSAPSAPSAPTTSTRVQLRVSDTGPGIAPELQESAFNRFWRGPHPEQPGSGLGLAIVREAARAMGGSARVEPTALGCTVVVDLGNGTVLPAAALST